MNGDFRKILMLFIRLLLLMLLMLLLLLLLMLLLLMLLWEGRWGFESRRTSDGFLRRKGQGHRMRRWLREICGTWIGTCDTTVLRKRYPTSSSYGGTGRA